MPDDKTFQILKVHQSTRNLRDQQIRRIASCGDVVEYRSDEIVHRPDQTVTYLLLIVSGELEISACDIDDSRRPIQYIGRDDQYGLLAMFQEKPFPVEVKAIQRTTAIRIEKSDMIDLMQELPLWSHRLMQSLGPLVKQAIMEEERKRLPRLVAIVHATDAYRELTVSLARRLSNLGENVGLMSDHERVIREAPGLSGSLLDPQGRRRGQAEIRSIAADWSETNRIILDLSVTGEAPDLAAIASASDAIYCVCDLATCQRLIDQLQAFAAGTAGWKDKLHVVRVLRGDEQTSTQAAELDGDCCHDFKVHWDDSLDSLVCTRRSGIERIVHHLRGVSIGLALGGGAARGMSHLGALQAFEQEGITIDRMSGTSAGALTGVCYAAGYSADFLIDAFAHDLKPSRYYRMLPYGDAWYMLGKYRRGRWDGMLRKYLHNWRLEQLPIPFTTVAADLVSACEVRRSACDATQAILESINLPGISLPICQDGKALVDGGILNVVPADVLADQGANVVIAVDVSARIRFEFAGNKPDTPTAQMKVPSTAQSFIRMRTVQDRNIRSIGGSAADLVIEPDVSQVELSDFQNAPKIAVLGRTATEAAIPPLRKILHNIDAELFPL